MEYWKVTSVVLLLVNLPGWGLSQLPPDNKYQIKDDCATAWECCRHTIPSAEFSQCCNDHGCCPSCGDVWSKGCSYNNATYSVGSVVEYHSEVCEKLQCVLEVSSVPPYAKAVVTPLLDDSESSEHICNGNFITKCVDKHGIIRAEGEEWFVSATCEQCQCQDGRMSCRPVKRPCPSAPFSNCRALSSKSCCPIWDCSHKEKRSVSCPHPASYGQNCFAYHDQCEDDGECEDGYNCCLVAGCGKECIRHYRKRSVSCPDPASFGRNCFRYHDQCHDDNECSGGSNCCLVAGCGKECIRKQSVSCPDPTSFGRTCIHYHDQCHVDEECLDGGNCCLVAGCGKECTRKKSVSCPDPTSFGLFCIHYHDQCQTDEECLRGRNCCLIGGCGKQCMRLPVPGLGNVNHLG